MVYFHLSKGPCTPVAQGIEHRIPNPGVGRSNRLGGTSKDKGFSFSG